MPYENVYDVRLLDDLHNYFPQLLYRPENFNTVQDVLLYIQRATLRRFNLFDYGRNLYDESNTTIPANTQIRVEEADFVPVLRAFINVPNRLTRRTEINNIFQDVIITASQELIEQASTQLTLDEDIEDICPICQDNMRQDELIRKLNVCGHTFHKSCVDNWFLHDSVLCPTCRHDIRQPARVSPLLRSSHTPVTLPSNENLTTENTTTPPRTIHTPTVPLAPSRNFIRAHGSEIQGFLETLFRSNQPN